MSLFVVSRCCLWLAGAGVRTKENTVQLGFKSKPSSKVKLTVLYHFKNGKIKFQK